MEKIIHYASYLANVILLVVILFLLTQSYGTEKLYVLLMAIAPALSLLALYSGPDYEEKRLERLLRKANLRKALKEFSTAKPKAKS